MRKNGWLIDLTLLAGVVILIKGIWSYLSNYSVLQDFDLMVLVTKTYLYTFGGIILILFCFVIRKLFNQIQALKIQLMDLQEKIDKP
ncbi:hypothetical protein E0485_24565 [Paenibacillus albiflavus]|uniref:Uncharacterized protein n=1 Tax=Paenibacillus albiflavus TaxID=2545760 RepID=A0A4V2WMB4_9BACL|nr:hypothetical protein [Paenibacillus albiflavus]TCZ67513.1 hypothetical protein E0485_24565 [Paenibacillus albiflavus]